VYTETQNGNIVFDDFFPNGNWQSINMDPNQFYAWHTPYLLSAHNPATLYYGGQQVARITGAPYGNTTNISPSLVDPQSPSRVRVITTIHESPLDQNVLYAGTADGKVWNSLDYGVNWNDVTPFQSSSYYVTRVQTSPNNLATAYVTRSGYRSNDNTPLVFKTTDNGATWTDVSGNLPALAVNDILVMPGDENSLFVANDAGVYYTTDAGVNWQRLGTGMPFVAVLDIHFNSNQSEIIAGTFGRSIYTTDISFITGNAVPNATANISLFPNPTSDFLQVQTSKKMDWLHVYDLSGKLVLTSTTTSTSVAGLASGVYVAEVVAGETVSRMKFVKR
ncbi:MAG: T9SS type A sorting domain-containing protein, partial [Bacteroidia bacterium]